MSRSQLVAEHLPLLRRYARALTGSQASGDAYVAAMLEAMLGDPSVLDESHGPRAGLFRLCCLSGSRANWSKGQPEGKETLVATDAHIKTIAH